jgi:hypothetical protein
VTSVLVIALFTMTVSQWIGPQRLTYEPGRSETTWPCNAHCIATDGSGRIYVVYTRDAWTDTSEIYLKVSTDFGINWLPEQRLTDATSERCYPSIALDTLNRVHIAWMDKRDGVDWQIYYKRSTDGGSSWESDVRISLDDDYSQSPCITTDGANEVYIVWYDAVNTGDHDIFFRKSTDGGVSWGAEMDISNGSATEDYPSIAFEPLNNLHVVWQDDRNPDYDIYYRRSTDRGATWGPEINIVSDTLGQAMSSIAANPSTGLHVTWRDARDSQFLLPRVEIYYTRSTTSGSTWGTDTRLTDNTNDKIWPNIAAGGFGGVHIVYQEETEIMYLYSADGGTNWATAVNVSSDPAVSMHPFVAVDSFVHVVWSDDRDGNFEIYYNRTQQPLGIQELTEFSAVRRGKSVLIKWRTEAEHCLSHWLVQRKETQGNYKTIGVIENCGSTPYPKDYCFEDSSVEYDKSYFYLLVRVDINSNTSLFGPLFVPPVSPDFIPQRLLLGQNTPNPFSRMTKITFAIPGGNENHPVKLEIYDVTGRRVRLLISGRIEPGHHHTEWDRTNEEGIEVENGVYFYRLSSGNNHLTKRMICVR